MKKLLCKIIGHDYKYNFKWMPTKCECKRCDKKWEAIKNPNYDGTNLLTEDLYIWKELCQTQ